MQCRYEPLTAEIGSVQLAVGAFVGSFYRNFLVFYCCCRWFCAGNGGRLDDSTGSPFLPFNGFESNEGRRNWR